MNQTVTIQKKEYAELKRKAGIFEESLKSDKSILVPTGVLKGLEDIKNGRIRELD